ncbi:MAG: hypothetical protein RL276_1523, partial [Bacteroidota bacterium]
MNRELKRISILIFLMFLSLFVATTGIQVIGADSYTADQRNVRSIYDGYKTQRGAILVDNKAIAISKRSDDVYRFQRT